MNKLDIAILVFIGWGLIRGATRGLIKEVASLAGVFVGFYAAYRYYPTVSAPIEKLFERVEVSHLVSFFATFIVVFLGVAVIGVLIRYVLRISHLGWTDKISGAVFGVTKGVFLSCMLVYALTFFLPTDRAAVLKKSLLAPHVTEISQGMIKYVPVGFTEGIDEKITTLRHAWESKKKARQNKSALKELRDRDEK